MGAPEFDCEGSGSARPTFPRKGPGTSAFVRPLLAACAGVLTKGMMAPMSRDRVFGGSSDPDAWLAMARQSFDEGRYRDSLRAHRFYHRHSIGRAGHGGVRLSFALMDWARLAAAYPPALRALRGTRDAAAEAAVGPPFDVEFFWDALAINRYLSDPEASYALINAVEDAHPAEIERHLTSDVQEALVSRGEYERCLRWMGDPAKHLEMAAVMLISTGGFFGRGRDARWARDRYVDEVRNLALILVGARRTRTANKLMSQARQLFDDPRLATAVEDARRRTAQRRHRTAGSEELGNDN